MVGERARERERAIEIKREDGEGGGREGERRKGTEKSIVVV